MADQNLLCKNVMHGFEARHLPEAKGTCAPSTNHGRQGGKGPWAKTQRPGRHLQLCTPPPPPASWATLGKGLKLSGSVSFSEN